MATIDGETLRWFLPPRWALPQNRASDRYTTLGRDDAPAVREFLPLVPFLDRVPALERPITWGWYPELRGWWASFRLDIAHRFAWHVVQEFAYVLNGVSVTERLPTQFLPVSPPPYLNGGPQSYLSWDIQCLQFDFPPSEVAGWLESRFPRPVEDLSQWGQG